MAYVNLLPTTERLCARLDTMICERLVRLTTDMQWGEPTTSQQTLLARLLLLRAAAPYASITQVRVTLDSLTAIAHVPYLS